MKDVSMDETDVFSSLRAPVVEARTWAKTSELLILSARRCRLRFDQAGVIEPKNGCHGSDQTERVEGAKDGGGKMATHGKYKVQPSSVLSREGTRLRQSRPR